MKSKLFISIQNFLGTIAILFIASISAFSQQQGLGLINFGQATSVSSDTLASSISTLEGSLHAQVGALVGEWRLSIHDKIIAKGDFNGDGVEDIVVTSEWGIGILSRLRLGLTREWTSLLVKPNGTNFGELRNYQSLSDEILGVGDFNGDKTDEIFVKNRGSKNVTILSLKDNTFNTFWYELNVVSTGPYIPGTTSITLPFSPAFCELRGIGDFDGVAGDELLLSNSKEIAVMKWNNSGFTKISAKPSILLAGDWANDMDYRIEGIGDMNGDGKEDIVATKTGKGLGVFQLENNKLTILAYHAYATAIGTWMLRESDKIGGVGNFYKSTKSDKKNEILITGTSGIGIFRFSASKLRTVIVKPNATWLKDWYFHNDRDVVAGTGNLDDDAKGTTDFLLKSIWGIGAITFDGSNLISLRIAQYGNRVREWKIEPWDKVIAIGKFTSASEDFVLFQHKPNPHHFDINGDGKSDIFHFVNDRNTHSWLSEGDGNFQIKGLFPNTGYDVKNDANYYYISGDFNGDGKTDLFHVVNNDYTHTWLSKGDGTYDIKPKFPAEPGYWIKGGAGYHMFPGDFNGDGKTDICHIVNKAYLHIWLSKGDGKYDIMAPFPNSGYDMSGDAVYQFIPGDYNGDRKTDLLHLVNNQISRVWLSRGDGTFDIKVEFPNNSYGLNNEAGYRMIPGDFNGDGQTDVFHVVNKNYGHLWLSKGDGTFDIKTRFPATDSYDMENDGGYYFIPGDFNGDMRTDLVHIVNNDYVHVWLSKGDGTFQIKDAFGGENSYWIKNEAGYKMIPGDYNGDGKTDLFHVVNNDYVHVWLSTTGGQFEIKSRFPKENGYWMNNAAGYRFLPEDWYNPPVLWGWVDMHTHPASQDAFGGEYFFGKNDGDPMEALGDCHCHHHCPTCEVQKPFSSETIEVPCPEAIGTCMNFIRKKLAQEQEPHSVFSGYPDFGEWPNYKSQLHQQMWWEWIDRARRGGLRVMVALAHNSHCLADASESNATPADDLGSMNIQIKNMIDFAGRHTDIMDTVTSSLRLKEVVKSNRIAVIIGVEMDNIGNFYHPADGKGASYNPYPSWNDMKNEIDRIWDMGVRYIFPIHITDNVFGGAAVYGTPFEKAMFNISNNYNNQRIYAVENTNDTGWKMLSHDDREIINQINEQKNNCSNDLVPDFIPCNLLESSQYLYRLPTSGYKGHRNTFGLNVEGEYAIQYMMQKGFLIDVDHMSDYSTEAVLNFSKLYNYPVNSGHAGLRGDCSTNSVCGSERDRTESQYKRIVEQGGMLGLGHGGNEKGFMGTMNSVGAIVDYKNLAIGTDVNIVPLPGPPVTVEGALDGNINLGSLKTGNKTWDYKEYNTGGVSHYGLLPEFFQSVSEAGWEIRAKDAFYHGADNFAKMWEKCERQKHTIKTENISFTKEFYRCYNGNDHFYTLSADNVRMSGYTNEGTEGRVYFTPISGTTPLYRLWNGRNHFYTIDAAERDRAISSHGYSFEKIECYVYRTQMPGSVPLYRMYSSGKGDHFYTIDLDEKNRALGFGYVDEGIACYVLPR